MSEFNGTVEKLVGPPGTGKTTWLAKTVRELVHEHGPESTMVSSFSVTAAKEIGSRFAAESAAARPHDRMIGTLHSHAFRAIGHGNVALDPKILADWNQENPQFYITPDSRKSGAHGGDSGSGAVSGDAVTGDELIAALDKLRATMTPREDWPDNVRRFSDRWEGWKQEVSALDFTDMVQRALERARDGEQAPGRPKFFIADEAQDQTPLETELILAWGQLADKMIIGMDDDQAINRWRGGDPEPLINLTAGPRGTLSTTVLSQSWRVPSAVHAVAERWVRRLHLRQEKAYAPRLGKDGDPVPGAAFKVSESIRDQALVRRIEHDLEVTDGSVMVIASCNYMLESLLSALRDRGIPFHNPYRPAEARWNPLGGAANGVSTSERVYRYLIMDQSLEDGEGRMWTGEDIHYWMDLVKLDRAGMVRGAKKMASLFDAGTEVPEESVRALFASDETFAWAVSPDVNWLAGSLLAAKEKVAAYPLAIARMHGPAALTKKPRLVVGTVHSVKGATADIVYVSPDISAAGQRNAAEGVAGRDELIRLFYVAMTRSYRELRLLNPAGGNFVDRSELLPRDLEVLPA
jgi:DNA helicase-2/ATP-dependent DNA helicase PcrA